jgi:glycosyltransferase involved in cell wall biosynthesis
MCSKYEGFGIVLIDSIIQGTPVIAFNCPHGPCEIIENTKYGVLVDSLEVKSFADAIKEIPKIQWDELKVKNYLNLFSVNSVIESYNIVKNK